VHRRRDRNTTLCTFKHSLVQEIAYKSLLRSQRRDLHKKIATALLERFPEVARARPEFVAHHLTLGGVDEYAVDFWERAAKLASGRSGNIEAASHCEKALQLLSHMDGATANRQKELRILVHHASALRATEGFGANATGEACYRACSLARDLEQPAQLLPALNGVYAYHLVRGEHSAALKAAQELVAVAHQQDDETYEMIGARALGAVLFHTGRPVEAVPYLQEALNRYDVERHRDQLFVYGIDHAETCACFLSMSKWILGEAERAFELQHWAVQHAKGLGNVLTLGQALAYLAFLHALSRDWTRTSSVAQQLISLSDRHSMSQMQAFGKFLIALSGGRKKDTNDPLRRAVEAADAFDRTSPGNYRPFVLTLIAEFHLKAGLPAKGLEFISEAEERIRRSNELWCEPEVHRVRGELQAVSGRADLARAAFQMGIEGARLQRARMWELRCALAAARLFRTSEAFADLIHVCATFPVDTAIADKQAADLLLREREGQAGNQMRARQPRSIA
jgi:tetratricopeptide (TPR) repeat protein